MSLIDNMTVESPDVAVESMSEDDQLSSDLPDFDVDEQSTILEEDDCETTSMVIMSDDAGQVYAPPAKHALPIAPPMLRKSVYELPRPRLLREAMPVLVKSEH